MNDLNAIISTFSNEEQGRFISYLEKKNKRNDTKNIQLFKCLLKDENDAQTICKTIYGKEAKGAYHALRKRFYQSIIDFTANQNLQEENSVNMQIIKYILAAKSFLQQKQYQVAYKILDKAEILATEHDLFSLLNDIYSTKIQYAHTNLDLDLNSLIEKFKINQKHIFLEDELNIVYTKIRVILNNIAYKGAVLDFDTILRNTFEEHNISVNDAMSFKSLYQLVTIVSISAFVTKDYLRIEPFLIETYKSIISNKNNEKQLYYHIQILYAIANALFRNKKFDESMHYLKLMHKQMALNKKKYYNTFTLKYHLLLALNYNYTNQQELAIGTLVPFTKNKHPDTESLLDIYLSLITFYFQKKELKQAFQMFSKFYHTDAWYAEKAGKEWVIKKNLIDILLNIELGYIDLVESRLQSFKRHYYTYLKSINQQRVITYLGFVETYYKNPEIVTSKTFHNKVENAFDWLETHREDIFVMSFYSWLKSKMNKTDLYETTLNLINQAQIELNKI